MKKVIDGHLYDTDKAREICRSDLQESDAVLFMTKSGKFFICESDTCHPMSEKRARNWAKVFGLIDDTDFDEKICRIDAQLTIKCPKRIVEQFNQRKKETGLAAWELLETLLKQ
jgi:hypothetical protein